MGALVIDDALKAKLADLKKRAEENPVNIREVAEKVKTTMGKAVHMGQMSAQTVDVPLSYCVTYSIEEGQPIGTVRHMSMAIVVPNGRVPHPMAVWEVAKLLGFWGEITDCDHIYPEKLKQGEAINLLQRMERPVH